MLFIYEKSFKIRNKNWLGRGCGGERIDLGFEKPGGTENEMKHGIIFPINVYPLFENAIRGNKKPFHRSAFRFFR